MLADQLALCWVLGMAPWMAVGCYSPSGIHTGKQCMGSETAAWGFCSVTCYSNLSLSVRHLALVTDLKMLEFNASYFLDT